MNEQTTKKPILKKWWFWLIIIVVIGVIIGVVASTAGGDDNTGGNNTATTNYYLNETVTSNSVQFTATEADNKNLIGTTIVGASTDNNFVLVTVTIKNTGNSEVSLTSSSFTLKKGNATYEPNNGAIYLENGFYAIETIGSGISKTVIIVFETPTASTEDAYTLSVKGGSFAEKKEIILTAKPA